MALILFIETGTRTCSVALAEDEKILSSNKLIDTQSHAKVLHSLIDKCLSEAEKKMTDLNAVVVGAGPGSYTGLRIGMAAAKGIAFTLDIPFIALDTLVTTAKFAINKIQDEAALYISTLNSRKGEIYFCILNGRNEIIEHSQPAVVEELNFIKYRKNKIYIIDNCKSLIKNNKFASEQKIIDIEINAYVYVKEGFRVYMDKEFDNIVKKNPLYLKPFS